MNPQAEYGATVAIAEAERRIAVADSRAAQAHEAAQAHVAHAKAELEEARANMRREVRIAGHTANQVIGNTTTA